MSGGIKFDQEKSRVDLLSPLWVEGVGRVLAYGAKKYADHNWRKGLASSRLLGAALRHTLSYLGGENLDPETGLSHLLHASCCLMFAHELSITKPETDEACVMATDKPNLSRSGCAAERGVFERDRTSSVVGRV